MDAQLDARCARQDQRTDAGQVRRYGREHQVIRLGKQHGTAGRQVVARAAGGGADDHAVGAHDFHLGAIQQHIQIDGTAAETAHGNIIQGELTVDIGRRQAPGLLNLGAEHHPFFYPAGALEEPALEDLVRLIMGEANTFLRRAPLAGIGAARRTPDVAGQDVYRIEKTVRPR